MKILFLTSSPLHKMHIVDMYIEEIRSVYDILIWDVSPLFSNKGPTDFPQIPVIQTMEEFENKLDEVIRQDKIIVITNILIYDLHIVYRQLHKRRILIVSIDKEMMISWMKDNYGKKHPGKVDKEERRKYKIKAVPILRQIYSYMEYRHAKFDYLLGACNYFPDASRHFFHIHNLKYDEYLHSKNKAPVVNGKYILFMDAGLAHLPSHEGKPNAIDKEEYLKSINIFFDKVEKKFKLPVIVAAHPKSGYQENDFKGRPIILYRTPELLKYAELVLAHYSTSLIELVLQKKKVIFMYSKDYMNSDSRTVLETASEYADMLQASLVDIKGDEEIEVRYDENAYNNFIDKYIICSEKRNYSNAELIIGFLKKLE